MLRRTPGSSSTQSESLSSDQDPPQMLEGMLVYPNGVRHRITGDLDFGFTNPNSGVTEPRRFCLYTFTHTDTDVKISEVPVFKSDLSDVERAVTVRLEMRTGARVERA
jgi:hypothetical protein